MKDQFPIIELNRYPEGARTLELAARDRRIGEARAMPKKSLRSGQPALSRRVIHLTLPNVSSH